MQEEMMLINKIDQMANLVKKIEERVLKLERQLMKKVGV
jgi:hypothetical protein